MSERKKYEPRTSFSITIELTPEQAREQQKALASMFKAHREARFHEAMETCDMTQEERDRALRESWQFDGGYLSMVRDLEITYPVQSPMTVVDRRHVERLLETLDGILMYGVGGLDAVRRAVLAYRVVDPQRTMSWTVDGGAA